jgi:hypothetical protein
MLTLPLKTSSIEIEDPLWLYLPHVHSLSKFIKTASVQCGTRDRVHFDSNRSGDNIESCGN